MCPVVAQETREKRLKQQEAQKQAAAASASSSGIQQNRIPGLLYPKQNQSEIKLKGNQPNTSIKIQQQSKSNKKDDKTSKISENLIDSVNNLSLDPETELAKKLKKLKKKIREIEVIETKLNSGDLKTPEKDQLCKVARKKEILKEIEELEKPK